MRRLNFEIRVYSEQGRQYPRLDDLVGGIEGLIPCTWLTCLGASNTCVKLQESGYLFEWD